MPHALPASLGVEAAHAHSWSAAQAEDIAAALDADLEARRFFESLATFYRKNFIRWIECAKRPETRAKRIAEPVATLKSGKRERQPSVGMPKRARCRNQM